MPGNNRPEAPQQQVSTPSWMEVRKGIIDVPKPPAILAEEQRLGGKQLEPVYAKGDAGGGRGGGNIVESHRQIGRASAVIPPLDLSAGRCDPRHNHVKSPGGGEAERWGDGAGMQERKATRRRLFFLTWCRIR